MSRIRRITPGLGRGGLLGNTEGPEAYLRELDTLPSQFCRATGGTETVIEEADAAVSLLLNFDGSNGSTTFTDQSIYAHTVTANGNAAISTAQSVFGGSSLALDGNGDYGTVPYSSQFSFGTGDFTVEAWIYANQVTNTYSQPIVGTHFYSSGTGDRGWKLMLLATGEISLFLGGSSGAGFVLSGSSALSTSTWYHVAATRSGDAVRLFVDGVEVNSGTSAINEDYTDKSLKIGTNEIAFLSPPLGNSGASFNGYIDSLRIVKGQAIYTGNFTPPASAPTNKTGKYYRVHTFTDTDPTSLLLNFDGSNGSTTFTDDSGWGHAVTANGNAAISTTQSKFGGSSLYQPSADSDTVSFSGHGTNFQFPSDFTIEAWVYDTARGSETSIFLVTDAGVANYMALNINATNFLVYLNSASATTAAHGLSLNTWHHIAFCRSGSAVKVYADGVEKFSATNSGTLGYAVGGIARLGGGGAGSTRYIDSLRITKGQAIYTAAFTPPTTALTRVGSGSLTFTRGGSVEYLVVGGGGGGGRFYGSGGGAGGYRCSVVGETSGGGSNAEPILHVAPQSHAVSVGGGGSGRSGSAGVGQKGSSSLFSSITADGGGFGAGGVGNAGGSGGSGGGGASGGAGGSGIANQGRDGSTVNSISSGAGGGASLAGSGQDGGDGIASSITGTSITRAGGGASSVLNDAATTSTPGSGGGGTSSSTAAGNGETNTGGGGGGGFGTITGGSGGSGIVIARYRITQAEYEAEAA